MIQQEHFEKKLSTEIENTYVCLTWEATEKAPAEQKTNRQAVQRAEVHPTTQRGISLRSSSLRLYQSASRGHGISFEFDNRLRDNFSITSEQPKVSLCCRQYCKTSIPASQALHIATFAPQHDLIRSRCWVRFGRPTCTDADACSSSRSPDRP